MSQKFADTITEDEKQDIINSYLNRTETIQQISDRYKKNHKTIRRFLKENNIHILTSTDTKFSNRVTLEEQEDIINLYLNEEWTLEQIAKKYKCDALKTLRNTLLEWGVNVRDTKFKPQYDVNINFFKDVNTEETAYWLGFLYADGCITRCNNIITGFACALSIVDLNHLEKFKISLQSDHYIEKYPVHYYDKNKEYICNESCRLSIRRKEMGEDLIKLGCIPAKSLILKYPTIEQVPLELQHHFIRGYFDGDGCISFNQGDNTSRENRRYRVVNILGTNNFLEGVKDFLNIEDVNIHSKENICEYRINSKDGVIEFYNKVYKDATIYLDRKHQKFQECLNTM